MPLANSRSRGRPWVERVTIRYALVVALGGPSGHPAPSGGGSVSREAALIRTATCRFARDLHEAPSEATGAPHANWPNAWAG